MLKTGLKLSFVQLVLRLTIKEAGISADEVFVVNKDKI
jgi:hypothetical protein